MTTQNDAATPTKAKAIPSNLSEIELQDDFKAIDKANTVKQLEAKLRDAGVTYLSSDNKAMLVWRYLDATSQTTTDAPQDTQTATESTADDANQGATESTTENSPATNAPDANSDDTVVDHSTQDTPDGGKVGSVTDQNQADKPVENQTMQSGDANDQSNKKDAGSSIDASASTQDKSTANDTSASEAMEGGTSTPTVADSTDTDAKADATETSTPASDDKNGKANQDGDAQSQAPKDDAKTVQDDAPKAPNVVSDNEVISVENTGAFNMLEPASMTLLKAREVTKITIKRNVSKAKVMGNIEQFNRTRGNILKVIN